MKYHLGHSNDWTSPSGRKVRLTLCFNPSHLEFVNPVALGSTRAKEDRGGDIQHLHGMAILIHGDAAMAGEGIVQETLNLSQLPHYFTGGTLHIVTQQPDRLHHVAGGRPARAVRHATWRKMLDVPIFHVNGEQPEAVAQALRPGHGLPPSVPPRRVSRRVLVIGGTGTTRGTSRNSRNPCSMRRSRPANRSARSTWSSFWGRAR